MNEFVIYPRKGRITLLSILSLIFIALGIFLVSVGMAENGDDAIKFLAVGSICILFFGFCLIYSISVLIKREPALIISAEGITDNSSYIAAGLVKWDEIENIGFVKFSNQVFLGIITQDPDLVINRTSKFKSMLNRMNKGLLDTQVNIPVKNLDCSIDDLKETINKYFHIETAEKAM